MTATITALPHLAVLQAHGPQAAELLQAQLTQDAKSWPPGTARMAAFCTPQGRMLADFLMWKKGNHAIDLLLDGTLAEAVLKRLRMFILRLQCKLDDVTAQRGVFGVLQPSDDAGTLGPDAWPCPAPPWTQLERDGLVLLRLPDAPGMRRILLVAESPIGMQSIENLQNHLAAGTTQDWALAEIRAGIPHVTAATAQQFVPQMLNYEALGAVDFKKGCYPGQEIVARMQYRGTIKRRTYRVLSEGPLQPGDEIVHSADAAQPCGMVINAAPARTGWEALAELKISATGEPGSLHARTVDGPVLRVADLPYILPPQD